MCIRDRFYGAYIIAVALLHIVNNLAIPAGPMHSYPCLLYTSRCV